MRNSCVRLFTAAALAIAFFAPARAARAQGTTIYVDGGLSSSSCSTYNATSRSCSGGSTTAYKTIAGAAGVATAGTTIMIRSGTYGEQLTIGRSGAAGQPITFRAYSGESPVISGLSTTGIQLVGRAYIVIDGLTITDVVGWARLEGSNNI